VSDITECQPFFDTLPVDSTRSVSSATTGHRPALRRTHRSTEMPGLTRVNSAVPCDAVSGRAIDRLARRWPGSLPPSSTPH